MPDQAGRLQVPDVTVPMKHLERDRIASRAGKRLHQAAFHCITSAQRHRGGHTPNPSPSGSFSVVPASQRPPNAPVTGTCDSGGHGSCWLLRATTAKRGAAEALIHLNICI